MNIGIDAREIQDGVTTGIGRPLANFIAYAAKANVPHTLVLFSERVIKSELTCGFKQVNISGGSTFLWDQWKLPRALKTHAIHLFYSPYYKIPLLSDIPMVSQVLDLMYLVYKPYRKKIGLRGRLYYATFGRMFSRKAKSIITDSDHAKNDIVRLWRINPDKISVIPLGLGARYKPVTDQMVLSQTRSRFKLPRNYLLYLGNFKPHKNVETLVRAFAKCTIRIPSYTLVLAGPLDIHGKKIQALVKSSGLEEKIIFTGTVRETDNPEALLTMAGLFVFPSFYEGFGLPPLEAMACGTPVIVSHATSLPEVVGNAGLLINPNDIDELAQTIARLVSDTDLRKKLSQQGLERSKMFSEKYTAEKIYTHLVSMLGEVS